MRMNQVWQLASWKNCVMASYWTVEVV